MCEALPELGSTNEAGTVIEITWVSNPLILKEDLGCLEGETVSVPIPQNQYQLGWIRGQADLVAALLDGGLTVDEAAANLGAGQLGPKGSPYHRGWFEGQMDLVLALRERRVTLRSAAISLGVRAPSELPREGDSL